jgi:hypothetical protein
MREYYENKSVEGGAGEVSPGAPPPIRSHLEVMPVTFRLSVESDQAHDITGNKGYQRFLRNGYEQELAMTGSSIWIVKPGENSNRGRGI